MSRADAMITTELDPKFTFDTFVVGPANRLESVAA
jgi:chromosomal replication initiation ATPase DnaA